MKSAISYFTRKPLRLWLPFLVLGAGLILTLGFWRRSQATYQREVHAYFDYRTHDALNRIEVRLRDYEQVLLCTCGLFQASEAVSRKEFATFVASLHLAEQYPGLQGIGFSILIPASEKERHAAAIRRQGFPDYRIRPEGERELYTSIIYLEPFKDRNLRAFGFDMFSEPVRREAMIRARDTDRTAMSGKVTLVQETTTGIQAGFLVYVPFFQNGRNTETLEARRANLVGWVYAPFRMNDLMRGVFGEDSTDLDIKIYDDPGLGVETVMFDRTPALKMETEPLRAKQTLAFGGHAWTVATQAKPGILTRYKDGSTSALIFGSLGSLLMGLLAFLISEKFRNVQQANVLLERHVGERTRELRKSEASYRNQFAANSSVMLLIDPVDGAILDANDAALAFYGYSREKLLAKRITDINTMPASDLRQALTSSSLGQGQLFERQHHLADGSLRDVEVSASTIQFGGRTVLHAIIHDITERKRAEDLRREVEQRLSYALDATGDAILDWNIETGLVKHNARLCSLMGLAEGALEHPLEDLTARIYEEDRPGVVAAIQGCLAAQAPYRSQHRLSKPDGTIIWVLDRGQVVEWNEGGSPSRMVGAIADITTQQEAQHRFERLFRNNPAPMTLSSLPEKRFTDVNEAFLRTFGYSREEILGRPTEEVTLFEDPEERDELSRVLQAEGRLMDIEMKGRRKDGTLIEGVLSAEMIRTQEGTFLLTVMLDITERKRVEKELLETNRNLQLATARANEMAFQAEQANRAKSEFLANMSHEIRTPMNGVIGMTTLLLDTELDANQRYYAETVRMSGEALLSLLNDILDLSKIEAGKLRMDELDFDLRALLDGLVAGLLPRTAEKGLEFTCTAAPDIPTFLRGDPGRLRQVLLNLAGNAIKFTRQGEVALGARLILATDADVVIRFSVKDSGIGIPKDKQAMLFQKFTQVDASITRQYGGTGLGLAISKQLTELMGGEIGVDSAEGRGSEFWFTVRLARQPERERALPQPADIRGAHVLVVDDNLSSREVLMTQLQTWSVRSEGSAHGPEAIQALQRAQEQSDPFQVAILDLQLPETDGASLARAVKTDASLQATHLVAMTSTCQQGDAKRMEEMGFAAYLPKPTRPPDLFGCLAAVLAGAAEATKSIVTRHSIRELNRGTMRILLAEDNLTNQQVALGILSKLGLRADIVENGAAAVDALASLPYDLVLMDVQMPEMDGLEATRRIRDPQSPVRDHQIPIIAMTAHAMQSDREKCLEAGMNDYVSKPVSPQILMETLDKWLPRYATEAMAQVPRKPMKESSASLMEPGPPVFDRDGMVARLMNDEELARTVATGFLEDLPLQIEALKGFLEASEVSGVARQAHSIKGASASVGGERLRQVAAAMEKSAKAGELAAVEVQLPELNSEFARLKDAMGEQFPISGKR